MNVFKRIYYGFINPINPRKNKIPDFEYTPPAPGMEAMDLVPMPGFPYDIKIKIVSCSSPFYWYDKISKIKDDAPNAEDKIFDVEFVEGNLYRTKKDTCGPGVKGFINSSDAEQIYAIPFKENL